MGTIVNVSTNCVGAGNTGVNPCNIDIKNTVGIIIVPNNFNIADSDLPTFLAALKTSTLAPKASRIYPIFNLTSEADNTEATVVETFKNGSTGIVRDGYQDETFQMLIGGLCLYLQVRKFRGQSVSALIIDSNGLLQGVRNSDNSLSGIPIEMFDVATFKRNDGSVLSKYLIRLRYAPSYLDSFGFVQGTLAQWLQVIGLQQANLYSGGARVAAVSLIKGTIGCGGEDLYEYASILGSGSGAAPLWVAKDAVSGNMLTITGVASNANITGYTGTVDTSDPDYNAAHPVIWSLADATTLNTAGVLSIESNTFTTPN